MIKSATRGIMDAPDAGYLDEFVFNTELGGSSPPRPADRESNPTVIANGVLDDSGP